MGFIITLGLAGCAPEKDDQHRTSALVEKIKSAYFDCDRLTDAEVAKLTGDLAPRAGEIIDAFVTGLGNDDFLSEDELKKLADLGVRSEDLNPADWQSAWIKLWTPYLHTEYRRVDSEDLSEKLAAAMGELDFANLGATERGALALEAVDFLERKITKLTNNGIDESLCPPINLATKLLDKILTGAGRESIPSIMAALSLVSVTSEIMLWETYRSTMAAYDHTLMVAVTTLNSVVGPNDRGLIPSLLTLDHNQYPSTIVLPLAKTVLQIGDKRALPILESISSYLRRADQSKVAKQNLLTPAEVDALETRIDQTVLEWTDDISLYVENLEKRDDESISLFCFQKLASIGASQIPTLQAHIDQILAQGSYARGAKSQGDKILIFAGIDAPEVESILKGWISKRAERADIDDQDSYVIACAMIGLAENYPETAPSFFKTLPPTVVKNLTHQITTGIGEGETQFSSEQGEILKRALKILKG